MKKSRYSEAQIVSVLKEAESGVPVSELCRTHGMSSAAFYQWRSKYGGMDASLISEMKQLQAENARLKRMYADIAMQNELAKMMADLPPEFAAGAKEVHDLDMEAPLPPMPTLIYDSKS